MKQIWYKLIFLLAGVSLLSFSYPENATFPGEITTPYPTLTCLAVEWLIEG